MIKLWCLILFTTLATLTCNVAQQEKPTAVRHHIEIRMGDNIASIKGFTWPKRNGMYAGQSSDFHLLDECELQIRLPSGRNLQYKVLNGSVDQQNQSIVNVYLRLAETSSDLHEAISYLNKETLRILPESKRVSAEEFIKFHEMNPDPSYPTGGVTFAVDAEVERSLRLKGGVDTVAFVDGANVRSRWVIILQFSTSVYLNDLDCCPKEIENSN